MTDEGVLSKLGGKGLLFVLVALMVLVGVLIETDKCPPWQGLLFLGVVLIGYVGAVKVLNAVGSLRGQVDSVSAKASDVKAGISTVRTELAKHTNDVNDVSRETTQKVLDALPPKPCLKATEELGDPKRKSKGGK